MQAAIGESETYHRMLDGTQFAAKLISQYPVIEKTYARVDSTLSVALRDSLEQLYVIILRFQIRVIVYFDANHKVSRTLTGLNPVSADENMKLYNSVNDAMKKVDHDIALVHADISQKGVSDLLVGQSKQLSTTMDGILALARSTGSAMREQKSLLNDRFDEVDAKQDKKMTAMTAQITEQWQIPLGNMMKQLEKEEIAAQEEQLLAIRRWLSAAQPEQDHDEARSKRPLQLGDWLLRHPKYVEWRDSQRSAILWMYGLPGTGKTNFSWRVIEEMHKEAARLQGKQDLIKADGLSPTFVESPSAAQFTGERTSEKTAAADGYPDQHAVDSPARGRQFTRDSTIHKTPGAIAFFYCSNDKAERGREEVFSRADPEELLRSIVSQLATRKEDRSIVPALITKYKDLGPLSDKQRILNYNECLEVILAVAADTSITIAIDALDECDHSKCLQLIGKLKDAIHRTAEDASLNPIKVFVATRSFTAIERELTPDHSLEVTADNNSEDVRKFIEVTLEVRSKDLLGGTASAKLKSDIRDTLSKRAQNMFLYASLLLNQLCDRHHYDDEESVRRKLDQLPKNLTDVYDRVIADIHDDKNNSPRLSYIAQNTFKWLLHAQELLTCDSMLEVVSSIGSKATIDEVIRSCRTLVVKEKSRFNFAHYSIREYLETKSEYSPGLCHLVATQSCLRVLNHSFEIEESGTPSSDAEKALTTYASVYWPVHHERIRIDDTDERWDSINIMLRKFLLQGRGKTNRYTAWLARARELVHQANDNKTLSSKLDSLQANPPSSLFAACVFGFPDIIGKFGRDIHGLNRCNINGQSALCLAIIHNKIGTVKALLSRRFPADVNLLNIKAVEEFEDFDPNSKPSIVHYATPLQAAAACGHREIAEYLLEKGAHIDLVAGYYGNALQAAALNGHESIVSLFLSRGTEPNSQGGYYGNALQAAAAQGHVEVINLLLENKRPALVSTPGGPFGSALMAAVCSGNSEIIWILLDEGADPNVKGKGTYGYPLAQAASMGFKDVVSLLLVAHAKANLTPREKLLHVLHYAAIHGMTDLAEYCLDERCNVDMETTAAPKYFSQAIPEDPVFMTPLALACAEGQIEMVKLLLKRGASVEVSDRASKPLWVAASRGQGDAVHLLIEAYKQKHGQDTISEFVSKCPPNKGHSVLFHAVVGGDCTVVRELLDNGVRYENNWFGTSPLTGAATWNRPQITTLLLNYAHQKKINGNFSINSRNRIGRTALFEAVAMGHNDIARILLEHGADWSIPNDINMTVLHKITHEGDDSIFMAYLLDKAYNGSTASQFNDFLNAKNHLGRTALMAAAIRNRVSCVDLLLKFGADWSLASNPDTTALHFVCWEGHELVLTLLLRTAQAADKERLEGFLNHRNDDGKTGLLDAVERNRPSFVKQLLDVGADYAITRLNGENALHIGSFRGHKEAVELVLEKASLDTGKTKLITLLNGRNDKGKTALMDAAETDQSQIIELLLHHGADYTLQDNDGFTALHYCAYRNHRPSVERLLALTSLDKSLNETTKALRFQTFLNHQSHTEQVTALRDVAPRGNVEIVDLLLNTYDADYGVVDNNGNSPLHVGVQWGRLGVVEKLLEYARREGNGERFEGFLGMRNKEGKTAWREAVERERRRMMEKLKRVGGDVG